MTEIKNGDTVVVDLNTPASSFHKAEGVMLKKNGYNSTSGLVRITKAGVGADKYGGTHKVGEELALVNLTKAPGFRVGTKAKYSGSLVGFDGQTVTVTEALMQSAYDYRVKRADGGVAIVWHHELQRIEEPVEPVKPESKFKIGDWVKVYGRNDKWDGIVGTVQKVDTTSHSRAVLYTIHKNDVGDATKQNISQNVLNFFEYQLVATEAPKPEAKFKVGDVVSFNEEGNKYWQGGKAKVRSFNAGLAYPYTLELLESPPLNNTYKDKAGQTVRFLEEALIPYVEPKPVRFKKGDIVKHKAGAHKYLSHEGKDYFIVDSVHEYAKYPVRVRALGDSKGSSRGYTHDELEAGEPLAQWEIELLDVNVVKFPEPVGYAKGGLVKPAEAVDGPAHYGGKDNPYEAIKVAEAWGFEKNAYLFNALKYLARAGKKGDKVEDLKKLVFYVQREIGLEEAK